MDDLVKTEWTDPAENVYGHMFWGDYEISFSGNGKRYCLHRHFISNGNPEDERLLSGEKTETTIAECKAFALADYQQRQPAARIRQLEAEVGAAALGASEAHEILIGIADSIQQHGHYSVESTLVYLDNARSAIREAMNPTAALERVRADEWEQCAQYIEAEDGMNPQWQAYLAAQIRSRAAAIRSAK